VKGVGERNRVHGLVSRFARAPALF
jgi:hypothetical protein